MSMRSSLYLRKNTSSGSPSAPAAASLRPIATSTRRRRAFVPWSMKKWWSGVSGLSATEASSAPCSLSRPSPGGTPSMSSAQAASRSSLTRATSAG